MGKYRHILFLTSVILLFCYLLGLPLLSKSSNAIKHNYDRVELLKYKPIQVIELNAGTLYKYDILTSNIESLRTSIKKSQKALNGIFEIIKINKNFHEKLNYLEFEVKSKTSKTSFKFQVTQDNWLRTIEKGKLVNLIAVDFNAISSSPEEFIEALKKYGVPQIAVKISETKKQNVRTLNITSHNLPSCEPAFFLHCKRLTLSLEGQNKKSGRQTRVLYEIELKSSQTASATISKGSSSQTSLSRSVSSAQSKSALSTQSKPTSSANSARSSSQNTSGSNSSAFTASSTVSTTLSAPSSATNISTSLSSLFSSSNSNSVASTSSSSSSSATHLACVQTYDGTTQQRGRVCMSVAGSEADTCSQAGASPECPFTVCGNAIYNSIGNCCGNKLYMADSQECCEGKVVGLGKCCPGTPEGICPVGTFCGELELGMGVYHCFPAIPNMS